MKPLLRYFFPLCIAGVLLTGCGNSAYSILSRDEGSGIKSVHVQVPTDATNPDMELWAKEIEVSEKVEGKEFMVVFYNGDRRTSHMMGSYEGSTFYPTSEADRQEAAREGD